MAHTPGPWTWLNMPRKMLRFGTKKTGYHEYDPGGDRGRLVGPGGEDQEVLWIGNDEQYYPTCGNEPTPEDAALIAVAPDMLAMLKRLEWTGHDANGLDAWFECPVCFVRQPNHSPDCELAALIAKAEGR